MQNYELLCVLPGTLTEEEVKPIVENIKIALEKSDINGATIKDLGKNRLAYPMKHIRYGYFQLFQFEAEGDSVDKLNKKLRTITEILRTTLTKYNQETRKETEKRNGVLTTLEILSKIDRDAGKKTTKPTKPAKKEKTAFIKKEVEKINLEDIDKNLDKILESDLEKV